MKKGAPDDAKSSNAGSNLSQWAQGDQYDVNETYDDEEEELYGSMEVMIGGTRGV